MVTKYGPIKDDRVVPVVDALHDAVGAALREEGHRPPVGEDGLLRHHALHQHVRRDGGALWRRRLQPHDDGLPQSGEGVEKRLNLGVKRVPSFEFSRSSEVPKVKALPLKDYQFFTSE